MTILHKGSKFVPTSEVIKISRATTGHSPGEWEPSVKRVDPFVYILIDDPEYVHRGLFYHLLDRSEAAHLRSLMTILMLPAEASALDDQRPVFSAALHRLTTGPMILRIPGAKQPEKLQWSYLLDAPLIVLLVVKQIPDWGYELAKVKHLGLLTPYDEIVDIARKEPSFHIGLLKGFADLKESYRVLGELIQIHAQDDRLLPETRSLFSRLSSVDLFINRPRLEFIPPIPLPDPEKGRPSAYLINRLSNNVDSPSLSPGRATDDVEKTLLALPRLLDYCTASCSLFAGMENRLPFPSELPFSSSEIEEHYNILLGSASQDKKMELWMKIGARLTGDKALRSRLLISVPTARVDLLKKTFPPTLTEESGHREFMSIKMQVVSDCIANRSEREYEDKAKKEAYRDAKETLVLGHRLLATHASYISISATAIPLQTPDVGGKLFIAANDLERAFRMRTRKVSKLFREFEIKLADSLPEGLLAHLVLGDSPVFFYSDLPYKWTLLDNFPICLTRPVSRIPVAATSSWLALTHMTKQRTSISVNHPNRVLVLDLISEHDAVRNFSELFRKVSDDIGQGYVYRKPSNPEELPRIIHDVTPEIVVLDTHGDYQRMFDRLLLYLGDRPTNLGDFIPDEIIPPVWILSACDMAVVGAIKGSMVNQLLERGAMCVVATLGKIDAYAAAVFVGRLLTDIYSPHPHMNFRTLSDVFFISQLTTALLYDPLFPLLRKAQPHTKMSEGLSRVIIDYIKGVSSGEISLRDIRYKAAEILSECLQTHGLLDQQLATVKSGEVMPETLLFTAFGIPTHVELEKDEKKAS